MNDRSLAGLAYGLGICGAGMSARRKRIPAWVFGCTPKMIAALLRGYFSADGSVSNGKVEVNTVSEKLARDVLTALSRLGIFGHLSSRLDQNYNRSYRVLLAKGAEVRRLADVVGFLQPRQQEKLAAASPVLGYRRRTSRAVFWDSVVSVEPVDGPPYSYDLSVDATERFVSGGVVVHNTEHKFQMVKETLRVVAPCMVFLDEIDKALGSEGGELTGGTSGRLRGEFLTWLQETVGDVPIWRYATANNIEILAVQAPELIRDGRWDDKFFADLPNVVEREQILQIHVARRRRETPRNFEDIDARKVADATKLFSGAELEVVVVNAMYRAFADKGRPTTTEDLLAVASQKTPLATTAKERIQGLRKWAQGRAQWASLAMPESTDVLEFET